jgi:putative PIN family toxin of toxin-antitoxin system
LRVFFDTNVLLAAFLTDGLCSKLLSRGRRNQFELFTCPFVLREFEEKLRSKLSATQSEIREALSLIREVARVVNPKKEQYVKGVCRDADDDNILTCALAANVDLLVTGDADLLAVKQWKGMKIITPRSLEMMF